MHLKLVPILHDRFLICLHNTCTISELSNPPALSRYFLCFLWMGHRFDFVSFCNLDRTSENAEPKYENSFTSCLYMSMFWRGIFLECGLGYMLLFCCRSFCLLEKVCLKAHNEIQILIKCETQFILQYDNTLFSLMHIISQSRYTCIPQQTMQAVHYMSRMSKLT